MPILPFGMVLQDVLREDAALALVVRLPAHRPREVLRVAEFRRAGRDEQLRHLLGVHVFLDRGVVRGAEAVEDQQHFVVFDQPARLFDCLRRRVAVVVADERDLAAVDAALGVDLVEIGRERLADRAIGRSRPAVRHDVADPDLGIARAGIIFLLRGGRRTPATHTRLSAISARMAFRMASSLRYAVFNAFAPIC